MEISYLKKDDVIGRHVRTIFHLNLKFDPKKDFQSRLIIVELDNNVRFSLSKDTPVIDPKTGLGKIYPYAMPGNLVPEIEHVKEVNLQSPIQALITPYEWEYLFGVVLENGFVFHDAFSDWDNGVHFYFPGGQSRPSLIPFELPST